MNPYDSWVGAVIELFLEETIEIIHAERAVDIQYNRDMSVQASWYKYNIVANQIAYSSMVKQQYNDMYLLVVDRVDNLHEDG